MTESLFYNRATFRHVDGSEISGAGSSRGCSIIARTLMQGQPVHAVLDRASLRPD